MNRASKSSSSSLASKAFRVNLNTSFLWLIVLLLVTLYLFVYNANDLLLAPATNPSSTAFFSAWSRLPDRVVGAAKLNEIRTRLDQFEFITKTRNFELNEVQSLFDRFVRLVRLNETAPPYASNHGSSRHLELPSIVQMLPQLRFSPQSIDPIVYGQNRTIRRESVHIVFGIPTVKREVHSYLIDTLSNLMQNLDEEAEKNALFVVFIADTDSQIINQTANEIESRFQRQIETGLIEIITAPSIYYKSLSNAPIQSDPMNDAPNRVRWRTKQNLDYAYLMMYCKRRGSYYVQLEDDIITKPNYYKVMQEYALSASTRRRNWLVIEFSVLGFIGRMFRSFDLPLFITFFLLFHQDKPVDWLLNNVAQVRYCPNDVSAVKCHRLVQQHMLSYWPPLFQHVGYHSSMKGKVQPLREKSFVASAKSPILSNWIEIQSKLSEKSRLEIASQAFQAHPDNPPCQIHSSFECLYETTFAETYAGYSSTWVRPPRPGQNVTLSFEHQPVQVSRLRLSTGAGPKRAYGKLISASVWVRPLLRAHAALTTLYGPAEHGFYRVASFDVKENGTVDCSLLHLSTVHSIRVQVDFEIKYPVVFTEILVEPKLD